MARWLYPADGWKASVSADLRVGGRYEVAMLDPNGRRHTQFGEYREIATNSRIVFTWSCPELSVEDSVVTVDLQDSEQGTHLTLTHELPDDPQIVREHEGGWVGCLGQLERFLHNQEH
jgi:uncharacterized protein YndB with AHSA1/START domain